ncbi:type IV secretion system protein VirB8 [Vibrio parahaemolyticus]|nr:type IV secretion system protein VirB8 [Vibrio parahaemolyticus]
MTLNKKEQAALFEDSVDFEVSKSIMAAKSEHRAWTITKGACGLTILSWLALALLMPLKTVEPYVVTVDKNSGQTQVVSVLDQTTDTLTEQEAIDRYWLSNYLRWREVYDWYTIQNDYNSTLAFSNPDVQNHMATIRFEKAIKQVESKDKGNVTVWVATVGYRYVPDKEMSQAQRLVNPLAFEVTSYRVDEELVR